MVFPPSDVPAIEQAPPASALVTRDEPRVTETDGLALTAGLGSQYVLAGVQAAYYFQIPHSLYRVVPYVAVGWGYCGSGDGAECALAVGMLGSWGHLHRLVVDLAYAPLGRYSVSFHGEAWHSFAVAGPVLSLGYEYMNFDGLCLRMGVGLGYVLGHPLMAADQRLTKEMTLIGLGYKFW